MIEAIKVINVEDPPAIVAPAGEVEFIEGKSAYEIAVAHGYTGSEEEWLSLILMSTPQTLTAEQRQQARANIKAATGGRRQVPADTSKAIDIKGYTSLTNCFEAPKDGYALVRGDTAKASIGIDGFTMLTVGANDSNCTFVPMGARLYVSGGTPKQAYFLPAELIDE